MWNGNSQANQHIYRFTRWPLFFCSWEHLTSPVVANFKHIIFILVMVSMLYTDLKDTLMPPNWAFTCEQRYPLFPTPELLASTPLLLSASPGILSSAPTYNKDQEYWSWLISQAIMCFRFLCVMQLTVSGCTVTPQSLYAFTDGYLGWLYILALVNKVAMMIKWRYLFSIIISIPLGIYW